MGTEKFAVTLMWNKDDTSIEHLEVWGPFDDEDEALDYAEEVRYQFDKYIVPEWKAPYSYGVGVTILSPGVEREFPSPEDYLTKAEYARYAKKRQKQLEQIQTKSAARMKAAQTDSAP